MAAVYYPSHPQELLTFFTFSLAVAYVHFR